ncbi:MAG TPA: ribosome maturation factor RimM [Gammaproteobacteria bacterium]|nr:ribosome maturation factor RimM [Gammaproteobacteria bacterium]
MTTDREHVVVGRVSGIYGVKGWVKVFSYTEPRENILKYSPWMVCRGGQWRPLALKMGRRQGSGIIAHLEGYDDRDQARALMGADIAVRRDQLADAGPGEYYWVDLIGLRVKTLQGEDLGRVDHLLETGANDVLVVRGKEEILIPYVRDDVVTGIDLEAGVMTVDWEVSE